jgi:L-threonylcarbamoyladenylate synthase
MTLLNTIVLDDISEAAEILRRGGLVAFPTETVFGLGADATNRDALERLFAAKGRPSDNPLIVHIAEVEHWPIVARTMPLLAEQLLARFSPGPLTVVLPKHPTICELVTAGLDTVGLRIPNHPQARQLLAAAGVPIAAPSANRSGMPSGTTWQTVLEDLDGRIDAVLRGSTCAIGIESTVVDCVSEPPLLLRPGAISLVELQLVAPELQAYVPTDERAAAVSSPGLRHPHYKPTAAIHVVESASQADHLMKAQLKSAMKLEQHLAKCAYCGLDESNLEKYLGASRRFDSVEEYAHELYEFMRSVDRLGIHTLYCQRPSALGIGLALNDRLTRAASSD